MKDSGSNAGGVGIFGVLLIVFVVLRLVGVVDWSWWWVLSPLWGGVALSVVVLSVVALVFHINK